MSFAPGSSAIAHLAGPKMNDLLDSRHPSADIDNALIPTANTTDPPDTADMDHTLKTIVAMIIISALIGNTLLSAISVLIVLVAYRITTPETTTITDAALPCEDLTPLKPVDAPSLLDNAAPANPTQDARIDDTPSEAIPLTEEEVHVYRHTRPTFDITEVLAPAPDSKIDISLAINDDSDCTGGLASDVFDFKTFERYLAEDKMYLTHPIHPNPAITSTGLKVTKKTNKKKSKKNATAARPAPKLSKTTVFNPKLSMIAEEDEIEEDIENEEHKLLQEEDIELPRSGSSDEESGHDNSFNSCADLEDFSEDEEAEDIITFAKNPNSCADVEDFSDEEDIIAFAKKVNRMCEELEKVERFSEPVEHTIALAQDWDATFRKWDEEELETFDSEEDAIAMAKKIEFDTRPSPPPTPTPSNTPADQTPEAPETRFSESGFLIESPDNSPAPYTPTPASRISRIPISRIPKATPKAPIFASPVGSPFGQHNRKVSNESNTTEESNQTNDTVGTTATTAPPDSPKLAYSTHSTPDDNVYSYQAMTGFTVCLSAKKGTGITFDPIAISGENINYDRDTLKEISPSPTSSQFGPADHNPDPNQSTASATSEEEQWETPYHYSTTTPAADGEEEDELQILAILERPSTGRKYAKLSCGNWYGYRETPDNSDNDDGFEVDHLTWDEYEDLIRFIVGDVASLPTKLHSIGSLVPADETQEEVVSWDEPEAMMAEIEAMLGGTGDNTEVTEQSFTEDITEGAAKSTVEDITKSDAEQITETTDEPITTEEANTTISSDQPDEAWFKPHQMPRNWFVLEHVRCPGADVSYYAEYVRGSDDMWYFRLEDPIEYRPLDARELRSFLNWRAAERPMTSIVEVEGEEFF
ncbi:hypothetical protein B0T20DRAFT_487302, partial [Sordaria brevicollis]